MKYLRTFLIAVALALASTAVQAQKYSEPKELSEGFASRIVTFDSGREVIQIVFPAKYRVFEENVLLFNEGAEHALVSYFGCEQFKECKAHLIFDDGVTAKVGLELYRLSLLRYDPTDPSSKVVGINAVKIPKVVL